jgi:hypothetical protein
VLRSVAILIAVAGMIDPAWSVSRPVEPRLVVIPMTETTTLRSNANFSQH